MKKFAILLLAAAALAATACHKEKTPDYTGLYQEIKSADKMVFASMAITKTAKLENTEWYKAGKRIAVYSYDSHLRAFIDLSALQLEDLEFDEVNHTVKVTLPPVQTEVAGRDMEMRKEYENIGIFRSDLDSKERAAMKEQANASFRSEVEDNPEFRRLLTEAAQRKARKYFESVFKANGYTASVDFKSNILGND